MEQDESSSCLKVREIINNYRKKNYNFLLFIRKMINTVGYVMEEQMNQCQS